MILMRYYKSAKSYAKKNKIDATASVKEIKTSNIKTLNRLFHLKIVISIYFKIS